MRRSVGAMILGIIGSSMLLWAMGMLVLGFGGIGVDAMPVTLYVYLGIGGGVIGIIGASLCYKKARLGALLLAIANALMGAFPIWFLIGSIQAGAFSDMTVLSINIMFMLPWLLSFVAMLTGLFSKKRDA